ncbi:Purine nucleoside phosphorylase 2 [bacterium HR40]|nr:Purine nucleoside phosphorylase 2 [bacterium HR40]
MRDLIEAAFRVRERAYAPYSGFRVGAAIRTTSGAVYLGCNVENASYPEGQCAEAVAIGAMVAAGERRIREIAIVGSGPDPCPPCGGCRQRLAEFAHPESRVHMVSGDGHRLLSLSLGELLPHAFAALGHESRGEGGKDAAAAVQARVPRLRPRLGLILGSGLDSLADAIEEAVVVPFADLPGLPHPTVPGHAGRLVLGRLGGVEVCCFRGRIHLYEGRPASAVLPYVRLAADLGCRALLLTCAAGSLRPDLGPGRLVRLDDHISLLPTNPLVGLETGSGPSFLDLSAVYDRELARALDDTAALLGLPLASGVYLATLGPCFETPAEIRAFRALGADLVGMSTVPEAVAARHFGLRVAAIAVVTNFAAGWAPTPLSHAETLAAAARAASDLERLLRSALPRLVALVDDGACRLPSR